MTHHLDDPPCIYIRRHLWWLQSQPQIDVTLNESLWMRKLGGCLNLPQTSRANPVKWYSTHNKTTYTAVKCHCIHNKTTYTAPCVLTEFSFHSSPPPPPSPSLSSPSSPQPAYLLLLLLLLLRLNLFPPSSSFSATTSCSSSQAQSLPFWQKIGPLHDGCASFTLWAQSWLPGLPLGHQLVRSGGCTARQGDESWRHLMSHVMSHAMSQVVWCMSHVMSHITSQVKSHVTSYVTFKTDVIIGCRWIGGPNYFGAWVMSWFRSWFWSGVI